MWEPRVDRTSRSSAGDDRLLVWLRALARAPHHCDQMLPRREGAERFVEGFPAGR
jgi:hypothetical protein